MTIVVDSAPPPGPSLREQVEELEAGQSLRAAPEAIRVLRVTASRVRKAHPDRQFRTSQADDGARIWRLA